MQRLTMCPCPSPGLLLAPPRGQVIPSHPRGTAEGAVLRVLHQVSLHGLAWMHCRLPRLHAMRRAAAGVAGVQPACSLLASRSLQLLSWAGVSGSGRCVCARRGACWLRGDPAPGGGALVQGRQAGEAGRGGMQGGLAHTPCSHKPCALRNAEFIGGTTHPESREYRGSKNSYLQVCGPGVCGPCAGTGLVGCSGHAGTKTKVGCRGHGSWGSWAWCG